MSWLKSFFGTAEPPARGSASAVNAIIFLASLASRPQEISPMLDKMRTITAMQKTGSSLSEKDQLALADVYIKLEQYLTQKEPVRVFSKSELTKKVYAQFKPQGKTDTVFWGRVGNETG